MHFGCRAQVHGAVDGGGKRKLDTGWQGFTDLIPGRDGNVLAVAGWRMAIQMPSCGADVGLSCQHIPRWGDVGRSKQGTCRMSQTTRSPHSSSNNFWVSRDIFWWHCPTQHWFLVRPVYRGLLLIFRGRLTLSRLACRSMPSVGWEIPTPTGHESCSWTNRRKWLVLHAL